MKIAICCTDSRADLLAQKFSQENISIYQWDDKTWAIWTGDDWDQLLDEDIQDTKVDLLFHHINDSLEDHKPVNGGCGYHVKFSGGGHKPTSHDDIGILASFQQLPAQGNKDTCPLNDEDVKEIIAWVKGERKELPKAFDPNLDERAAIFMLCDAYLRLCPDKQWNTLSEDERENLQNLRAINQQILDVTQQEWWETAWPRPKEAKVSEGVKPLHEAVITKKQEPTAQLVLQAYNALKTG